MKKEPRVGVIIPTYNNIDDLKKTVESIEESNYENYFIIIVDDGSSQVIQNSLHNLYKKDENVIVLLSDKNTGFAASINLGSNKALERNVELLFFVNNDLVVDKNCIEKLVSVFKNPTVAITGPKVYLGKTNKLNIAGGYFNWKYLKSYHRGGGEEDKGQYDKKEEVEFIMGCAFMVRAEVFKKFGQFDEKYFIYGEEEDFCYQILRNNYKIIYEPKAIAYHEHAKTIGKNSRFTLYYFIRNRLYFARKNGNYKLLILNIYWVLKTYYWSILKEFIKNNIVFFKAVTDFLTNKMGKGIFRYKE